MQILKQKVTGASLFLVALSVFIIVSSLMTSAIAASIPNGIYAVLKYMCLLLVLFKIVILTKYTVNQLLILIPVISVICVSAFESGSNLLLFGLVFIIGSKDITLDKIIMTFFYASSFIVIGLAILSIIGIIPNNIYYRGSVPRYSFGSNYPTDFGAHIFYLLVAKVYLRRDRYGYSDFIMGLALAVLIGYFCGARLDSGLIVILSVGMLIISKRLFNRRVVLSIFNRALPMAYIFFSVFIITLSFTYNADQSWFRKLDVLLSERLSLGHVGFDAYGIKLFGQNIVQHGWGGITGTISGYIYFFLDSSYMQLLLMYGLLPMLIFILAYTYVSFRSMERGMLVVTFILSIIALSGILDHHIIDLAFNPFLYVVWGNILPTSLMKKDFELKLEVRA
ncbi:hypothetical protein ACFQH1_02640 [Lactiplantibacillus daoliensis]|uniref:Polysaccharide polymerase n=1 Tax=Lactiplantibacillus daoliensis TaxID=2559916 RepID=A0ABW1UFC8_9LACO|nr:hypothetical protein [Lactiplantibacillus daoliensis]